MPDRIIIRDDPSIKVHTPPANAAPRVVYNVRAAPRKEPKWSLGVKLVITSAGLGLLYLMDQGPPTDEDVYFMAFFGLMFFGSFLVWMWGKR